MFRPFVGRLKIMHRVRCLPGDRSDYTADVTRVILGVTWGSEAETDVSALRRAARSSRFGADWVYRDGTVPLGELRPPCQTFGSGQRRWIMMQSPTTTTAGISITTTTVSSEPYAILSGMPGRCSRPAAEPDIGWRSLRASLVPHRTPSDSTRLLQCSAERVLLHQTRTSFAATQGCCHLDRRASIERSASTHCITSTTSRRLLKPHGVCYDREVACSPCSSIHTVTVTAGGSMIVSRKRWSRIARDTPP